ncbi:ankyrin repeat domain-containing protein [Dactylosporangium sp. NPDC006015]|uniref:ankyrin repeat domain-containing protein n=1 Tax=Dactylosporangium sp. NPDC006015 TaxID=3154576 RepID=UPI0033B2AC29
MSAMPPSAQTVRRWLRHRRYGVPPAMIDAATERRLAGDWRRACAAAHVTPDIDLRAVEWEHGREVAAAVEDDLRHLAPDLLRWHEPLHGHHSWPAASRPVPMTRLAGGLGILLASGPRSGGRRLFRLRFGGVSPVAPLVDRHLWDVRQAPGLRGLCGPEPVSTDAACPHATGRQREAAAAAGIDATGLAGQGSDDSLASHPLVWSRLVPAARALLHRHSSPGGTVDLGEGWLDLRERPTIVAGPPPRHAPLLQISDWQEPLDAELVRHGLIDPDALHPLVHDALLPGRPQSPPRHGPLVPAVVPVECGGRVHRLAARDGQWHPLDHDLRDLAREEALAALGGPAEGCAGVLLGWRTGSRADSGLLPPPVQDLHDELWQRVAYGDTDGVLRLLGDGFPPAADRGGGTLLHALGSLDHARMLPRLLALGLDVHARTNTGDTPLHAAARSSSDAAADLVEALLRAGADPRAVNHRGQHPADLAGTPEAAAVLRA